VSKHRGTKLTEITA